MSFDKRKKKALQFEKKAGEYIKKRFPDYKIEDQKVFSSGRRPDYWLVSKRDPRNRIAVEVKYHLETEMAHESDLKQLRMYQHHGMARKGVLVYPDSVRVPRELRREARESGQEIVRISEGGCFIATAAFGTSLAEEIDVLREYRDRRLLQCALGKCVVRLYYNLSPPIANLIAQFSLLRRIVRVTIRCILAQLSL